MKKDETRASDEFDISIRTANRLMDIVVEAYKSSNTVHDTILKVMEKIKDCNSRECAFVGYIIGRLVADNQLGYRLAEVLGLH